MPTRSQAISYFWQWIPFSLPVRSTPGFFLYFLVAFASGTSSVFAQITGPEQDCGAAIAVCQTSYIQNQSYQGSGTIQDLTNSNSCLENDENNSVWYIFTVTITGRLELSIIPQAGDDYDFALYDITGGSCADVFAGTATEVRCNYAFTNGPTGLRSGYSNNSEGSGGQPFVAPLNVNAGETYALVVDNFASTPDGYTLDFNPGGQSTASIIDFTEPSVNSIAPLSCTDTDSLIITFSEPVLCSSIAAGDFQVTGPSAVTITSAYSPDCNAGSFTLGAVLRFSAPITVGGNYSLDVVGAFEDNCGNEATPGSVSFTVPQVVDARFTYQKFSTCVADTFKFTNTSVGSFTSVLWDFGNGDTSTDTDPVYVYTQIDTYTVTLTVSSADCSDSTANSNIEVTNSFIPLFTYSPAEPCVGEPVSFTDSSQAVATDYQWDFGDSNSDTQQNTAHTYLTGGVYNVTFTISDQNLGCTGSTEMPVLVHEQSDAAFQTDDTICSDIPVNFIDLSAGSPASWTWNFPDGSTSNSSNPSFTFTDAGTYQVELTVVDSFCNGDNVIQDLDVLTLPFFYLGNDTMICRTEEITLQAYPGADAYLWSTGQTTAAIVFDSVPSTVWATAYLGGCPYTDSMDIAEQVENCSFAVVPSGFSPNTDGSNDLLRVLTKRVSTYEIIIYNRWGQEVYRGSTGDTGWDGSFKDEPQDIGVFSYVLRWADLNSKEYVEHGSVTLVR